MEITKTLKKKIRRIQDFPKKGILFRDITPIILDGKFFRQLINYIANIISADSYDVIVAVESRGYIFASPLAYKHKKGLAIVRKGGKLPYKTLKEIYELEYGQDSIEIHEDAIKTGQRVLILDDLLATGGTAKAVAKLVEKLGGKVSTILFIIELLECNGREKLQGYNVLSLISE